MTVSQIFFILVTSCVTERIPYSNAPTQTPPNKPNSNINPGDRGTSLAVPFEEIKDPKKYCIVNVMRGNGTEDNPLLIENESQFITINKITKNFWSNGCYFKLINNLDFKDKEVLQPIGDYEKKDKFNFKIFKGFFDGNNKSIKNLTIQVSLDKNIKSFGLFSSLVDSHITNLSIENIKFNFIDLKTENDPLIKIGLLAGDLNILSGKLCNIDNINIENEKIDLSSLKQRINFSGLIGLIDFIKPSCSMKNIKIKINKVISNDKSIALGFLSFFLNTVSCNFDNIENIDIDIKDGIKKYRCFLYFDNENKYNDFYHHYNHLLTKKNIILKCDY